MAWYSVPAPESCNERGFSKRVAPELKVVKVDFFMFIFDVIFA